MPKILINEKDRTSPGTPDGYNNFAVLIAGFKGMASTEPGANIIQPDANEVYEFTSAQDFKDTIGLKAPSMKVETAEGAATYCHYGNQMAYELLNMGYSIVYKPIEEITELADAKTWEIFKDKASYDFRFITHGLLESEELTTADKAAQNNAKAAKTIAENKLSIVQTAKDFLKKIDEDCEIAEAAAQEANKDFEKEEFKGDAFSAILQDSEKAKAFVIQTGDNAGQTYLDYNAAVDGTETDSAALESEISELLPKTKDSYYITLDNGLINGANTCIANLAKYKAEGVNDTNDMDSKSVPGRGDCIALIEIDEKEYLNTAADNKKPEALIIDAINKMSDINGENGKYCAMTVPSVVYKMTTPTGDPFGGNKKFPGAFHYLACFINSLNSGFAEWYAAAGYTRGVSSYTIDYTTVKLGEIAINALEPRNRPETTDPKFACNVIANFRGSYYLWGNRTAAELKDPKGTEGDLTAKHFLNIRQLCITIKKQLYVACRRFTFDPNSDTLWVNFCNAIRPTLDMMKADQGIRDYKILKIFTDKKATLKAKIRIIPIEAVEDFDLEVSLEDSFGETAAVVTE